MTTRMLIEAWQKQGLMGVEVYHPSQQKRSFAKLDAYVRRQGLLVTGGSDYHGAIKNVAIGDGMQYWKTKEADFGRFLKAISDSEDI